jgi:hypothetical protein
MRRWGEPAPGSGESVLAERPESLFERQRIALLECLTLRVMDVDCDRREACLHRQGS